MGALNMAGWQSSMVVYGNAMIAESRNRAIQSMATDADYLVMVDDDMMLERDAFVKLLAHRAPVVTILSTTRVLPVSLNVKFYDAPSDTFKAIGDIRRDRSVQGPFAVGTGMLALSRSVVEALIEHHLTAQDWLDATARSHQRMQVSQQRRERERMRLEGIRRERYAATRYARIFEFPTNDEDDVLGEDIALSRKLLSLGYEPIVDPTIKVGHVGEYAYSPDDYIAPQQQGQEAA